MVTYQSKLTCMKFINSLANGPILYPLKTRFSCVFRGCKVGTLATNGLIIKFIFCLKLKFDDIFHNIVEYHVAVTFCTMFPFYICTFCSKY